MNKQARSWIPSILLLIVLFVGGYWFMTRQFTINNSYSQQDFYESVQNNEVESVYIHPNKEYPTGRVSVDLTNGNSVQFYALDVKEIQDFLGDYSEIALEYDEQTDVWRRRWRNQCQDDELRKEPCQDDGE